MTSRTTRAVLGITGLPSEYLDLAKLWIARSIGPRRVLQALNPYVSRLPPIHSLGSRRNSMRTRRLVASGSLVVSKSNSIAQTSRPGRRRRWSSLKYSVTRSKVLLLQAHGPESDLDVVIHVVLKLSDGQTWRVDPVYRQCESILGDHTHTPR